MAKNKHFKRKSFKKGDSKCKNSTGLKFNHNQNKFRKNAGKDNEESVNSNERTPKISLKEDQVGITEYVSNLAGFSGIIKARFSDFHVNEIDLEGKEVRLDNMNAPVPPEDNIASEKLITIKEELSNILTKEIWENIDSMLNVDSEIPKSVEINVTDLDKDKRTLIHKVLKEQYGPKITSSTITDDQDKKYIKCTKSKGKEGDQRTKWLWPGDYVYFVLYKENADTVQAASDLAFHLRVQPSLVNYAGTKDKRAKTTQIFCVKKREPSQIVRVSKRYPYLKVGNFDFRNKVLKLGELKGNRFRIVLRNITSDESIIESSLHHMKEKGFINYYGLQRFGNCAEVPTYKIGIALLKADYKSACELILKPRKNDIPILRAARDIWWKNRNSAEAASLICNNKFIEKKLLEGLAMYGENDYATALRKISRNMLMLYTHAYQSLIWNKIASRRIKEFGFDPIVGDLIYTDEGNPEIYDAVNDIDENILLDDEELEEESTDLSSAKEEKLSIYKSKVRPLTEEDISKGKYSIFDIVLPLPGYDITYPSNEVKDWYDDLLAQEQLSSEKLKTNIKTFSLGGAYRKLVIRPENMNWEFKNYDSPTSTLILSDYEQIRGDKIDENPEGKLKALLLDFMLPASSYATMALREVLKMDTSTSSQAKLNDIVEDAVPSTNEECSSLKRKNEDSSLNEDSKKQKE